jgi:hypothetical protein
MRLEFHVPAGQGGAGHLFKKCLFLFHPVPLDLTVKQLYFNGILVVNQW